MLQEALKKVEYKQILKKAGFGLELEAMAGSKIKALISSRHSNHYGSYARNFVKKLIEFSDRTQDADVYGEVNSALGISNSKELCREMKRIMEKFGPIFFGGYGGGRNENGWRVETDGSLGDYGVEIVTPLNGGEAMKYSDAVEDVSRIAEILTTLGFVGSKKTGLHIHVSYDNKINNQSMISSINLMKQMKTGPGKVLSSFAVAAYLSNKEADFFAKQGDYNRRFTTDDNRRTYSRSFYAKITTSNTYIFKTNLNQLIGIHGNESENEFRKLVTDLIESRKKYNKYIVKIPLKLFTKQSDTEDTEDTDNSSTHHYFNQEAAHYLYGIKSASHNTDISARSKTVELRTLGGKKALESVSDKELLGKILRNALTQMEPVINKDSIKLKDIYKATYTLINSTVIKSLNEKLERMNKMVDSVQKDSKELNYDETDSFTSFANKLGVQSLVNSNSSIFTRNELFILFYINRIAAFELTYDNDFSLVKVAGEVKVEDKKVGQGVKKAMIRGVDVKYNTLNNRESNPKFEEVVRRVTSANSQAQAVTSTEITRSQIVNPGVQASTINNSNELFILIDSKAFYLEFMYKPSVRANSLTFEYGDNYRYIHKYETKEEAKEAFAFITRYITAAERGASLNQLLTYRRVSDINSREVDSMTAARRVNRNRQ